jgi:fumarate reductase subunit C
MGSPSHPQAMAPPQAGPTRTAPPQKPASWPSHPRMRVYSLFGLTGFVYLAVGFVALRAVWALGGGPAAWRDAMDDFANPLYLAFHALALVSVVFVIVRFFRLFPKAQPARLGPLKPPPRPVIQATLYAAWLGATLVFAAILAGGILR